MIEEKVLFVDDDKNLLTSYVRSFREEFPVSTAPGGNEGLETIKKEGPFAVIVSDLKMPGMDGIQFLEKARENAPKSVRMLLTGFADLQMAMDAVNKGYVFRIMTKPCGADDLARFILDGVAQYRLVMAEKELLEKTLSGGLKVLTDILSLVSPKAFSHSTRARRVARLMANELRLEPSWQLEIAAMLSQLGCVTIPEAILEKVFAGKPLEEDEEKMYRGYSKAGGLLVGHIPRLERIRTIIENQEARYSDPGGGNNLPLESRILKASLDYDLIMMSGMESGLALVEMHKRDGWYDPRVMEALERIVSLENNYEIRSVLVEDLKGNMILAEDILDKKGMLLVARGQEVTTSMRIKLNNYRKNNEVNATVKVVIIKNS